MALGGDTEPAEPPRQYVEVNGAGDRVIYAFQLYKQGVAPVLLLSGGDIDFLDTSSGTPADDMATLLTQFGVPKDALWLDRTSQNTYENAVNCAAILKQHGVKSVILVTSAMHMPRAMAMFKSQGVDAIPALADYGVTYAGWDSLVHGNVLDQIINLFPSAGNLSLTTNALKEYMGSGYYACGGIELGDPLTGQASGRLPRRGRPYKKSMWVTRSANAGNGGDVFQRARLLSLQVGSELMIDLP